MKRAGRLTKIAVFQQPVKMRNEDGQVIDMWVDYFDTWVNVRWLRGGESVMQARLASKSPAILTFRAQTAASSVTSEWRVVFDGKTYDLKEDPRESEDRSVYEVLVERVG